MISGLHHVAVAVSELDAAAEGFRRLLGVEPERQDGGGARRAWFRFPNAALELVAPEGEGPVGDRVRAHLDTHGEGVWALAFITPDATSAARLLPRRGIRAEPLAPPSVAIRAEPVDTAGLQVLVVPLEARRPSPPLGAAPVAALDHVVIHTTNIDRALAIYGAKLGLDLRLDIANEQLGARQLFFRAGDAVVELGARLDAPASDHPDRFGGLAWRVADLDAARTRLGAAGFDVSEARAGRKPGTRVFTVRDAPAGVPTLMLSAVSQLESA